MIHRVQLTGLHTVYHTHLSSCSWLADQEQLDKCIEQIAERINTGQAHRGQRTPGQDAGHHRAEHSPRAEVGRDPKGSVNGKGTTNRTRTSSETPQNTEGTSAEERTGKVDRHTEDDRGNYPKF